jgi:nitrogen regulatory protein PII 2
MKEIIAIIRPNKGKETKERLSESGFYAYSTMRVSGRGKERGLRYAKKVDGKEELGGMRFLPKRLFYIMAEDDDAGRIVEIIMKANRTGQYGDGKIFVTDIDRVVRIRTGEEGREALL